MRQGAVADAGKEWKGRQKAATGSGNGRSEYPPAEAILQSIPRRQQSVPPDERKLCIPYIEPLLINNTFIRSIARILTWFRMILTITLGNFFDTLLRRDTLERRAVRFRKALESAGGTVVKFVQQLAL